MTEGYDVVADLKLEQGFILPVVKVNGFNAMISMSIDVPWFFLPVNVIASSFGGAELVHENVKTYGDLGKEMTGNVYEIGEFTLGDIHYKGLHVFVPNATENAAERDVPIVLTSLMLGDSTFSVNPSDGRLKIEWSKSICSDVSFKTKLLEGRMLQAVLNGKEIG